MKNKRIISDLGILSFYLTIGVALISWIASIYGWGDVNSLLSAEGMRWVLGHVVENYVQTPALGIVLILFMGIGVGFRAGLYEVIWRGICQKRKLSRKERRALILTFVMFAFYGLLVLGATMLPWNFLQSATGSWLNSPFFKGAVYVISIGVGLSGMVYGYASNAFHSVYDVIDAMSCLIARCASFFVSLFFIVQFFSSLMYIRFAEWMDVGNSVFNFIYHLFCYLPLLELFVANKRN